MHNGPTMNRVVLSLCLALTTSVATAQTNRVPDTGAGSTAAPVPARPVQIIPIDGVIDSVLHKMILRGFEEAEETNAQAIIFDVDTPGGKLDTTEDIVSLLLKSEIPTYAFVNPRAISAGAMISMATDNIYMTSDGLIGDAMPILVTMGGAQAVPEDLRPKILSPTRALVRMIAQQKGLDPAMAEAMVDPTLTFSFNGSILCNSNELLTLTSAEAAELDNATGAPLLSAGTVDSMEEFMDTLGLSDRPIQRSHRLPGEIIAGFLSSATVSGILLAVGLLGVYVEVKTPGFGFPGIIGICALLVWFTGHHIAEFSGTLELVLFLCGVALLALEIFVVPGFGITGVAGIGLIGISIFMTLVQPAEIPDKMLPVIPMDQIIHALETMGLAVLITTGGAVVLGVLLPATPAFKRLSLATVTTGNVAADESGKQKYADLIGLKGQVVSSLRPSGRARIGNQTLDVITGGNFIETGATVRVVAHRGNHVEVEQVKEDVHT